MNKEIKLSAQELENVVGGTCHSKGTYESLDIGIACLGIGQESSYHPVITTMGNRCAGWKKGPRGDAIHDCFHCNFVFKRRGSMTFYCCNRSKELDNY